MRILLGIAVLVLVAILWSAISILRHIRVGRRRNALLRRQHNEEQVKALRATGLAPLPARFAAPLMQAALPAERPAYQPTGKVPVPSAARPQVQPIARASIQSPERTVPSIRPMDRTPAPSLRVESKAEPARIEEEASVPSPLRILEVSGGNVPQGIFPARPALPALAARQDGAHTPPPPAIVPPPPADPNSRRPVRSVHHQPEGARPAHRPDWIYFNKDMGDLSDPAPSRVRIRGR